MAIEFKRATRAQVALKLGLTGPSGSGKTTAALRITRGLVGPGVPIALLDTENGSASLYADITEFDVLNMTPPYRVEKFIEAINVAVEAGFKALIIDSASHEWIQILQDKEALDARGGNQWTNWATFTKKHEEFLTAIRNAPIHLVLCLRAKEKHEMNDAKKVVKLGMGSQTRDGFEYELTTVFDIAMDHSYKVSKDRTRIFDGRLEQITEATGRELAAWLAIGAPLAENTGEAFPTTTETGGTTTAHVPPPQPPAQTKAPATPARAKAPAAQKTSAAPPAPVADPPPEWIEAMVELTEVTLGMPEKTRAALVASFEAEGPAALGSLKAEIKTLREAMEANAPKTAGEVIANLDPLPKTPVSQAASDFVDEVSPDTDEANGGIDPDQYLALTSLIGAYGINRDALRAYCAKAGQLLPGKNGPTLSRMTNSAFCKLREDLANKDIASKGETWSARRIRIINATPITTFQPIAAAS